MKKFNILLLFITLVGLQQAFPQAISYTYDALGNLQTKKTHFEKTGSTFGSCLQKN
jgi:YD repeat-containing protein